MKIFSCQDPYLSFANEGYPIECMEKTFLSRVVKLLFLFFRLTVEKQSKIFLTEIAEGGQQWIACFKMFLCVDAVSWAAGVV